MLEELLGSKTRARLLVLLSEHGQDGVHLRELVREVGLGSSGVQREVARLEGLGVVRSTRDGAGRRIVRLSGVHPFAQALEGLVAAETAATYATRPSRLGTPSELLARLNPRMRGHAPAIADACRRHGVVWVAVFGSSANPDPLVTPRDLDIAVRFGDIAGGARAEMYFGLTDELRSIAGTDVDLVEIDAITNPYLMDAIRRTEVVLYGAP